MDNGVYLSVILPEVSDESRLMRFCSALLGIKYEIELLICGNVSEETSTEIYKKFSRKVKFFPEDGADEAVYSAKAKYIIFSDVNAAFAENAVSELVLKFWNCSGVCNAAVIEDGNSRRLLREGFRFNEAAAEKIYCNYFIQKNVITENKLHLHGSDPVSVLLFIAMCAAKTEFSVLDEVLVYTDKTEKCTGTADRDYLGAVCDAVKTADFEAQMFLARLVCTLASENMNADTFEALKTVMAAIKDTPVIAEWARGVFGFDTDILFDGDTTAESFGDKIRSVHYKEISLPMNRRDVIMNFYSGKFGIDVLKKCIGAWLYYKFYRGKDGFLKKLGCKAARRLLGGEFDV